MLLHHLTRRDRLITICVYPGHPEGEKELDAVYTWARALPNGYHAMVRAFLNPASPSPALIAVQRIR